ncbi:stage III sporulation protein AF [Salipaludibacillus sp. HK11]|uniref:stage III sporulation protein AF n=1 Tax=Salipaludibacillus sp. HK11 TaxID=3394320 RepID=UPI0039FD589C
MAIISSWITNIILLILFATILELLLPNSSTHRYVKLVVGLMLLVAMLQPVLSIFQEDPETILTQIDTWGEESYEEDKNLIELEKSDIESDSLAYISEQVAVQLKGKAQTPLINEFQKEIIEVNVTFLSLHGQGDIENLEKIDVTVKDVSDETEENQHVSTDIKIDTIVVESETTTTSKEGDTEGINHMETRLAEVWEVSEDVIVIRDEGGDAND